ncbi:Gfo/Idh/MocA family protein [Shimia biformata]|uniref:Gfo/Idh/MocA family protein n=1 Tax=Shimia biformata TaxID=1294299 RepID=UPI001951A398|nr:Gfo/Idh/MocA family oxidoreductase [Shimia biformata]
MTDPIRIGIVGIDHRHIYTMTQHMLDAGCVLAGWFTEGEPGTLDGFVERFPDAPRVAAAEDLIDAPDIDLILTAAVPSDRAAISVRAMRAGKDVLSDKPGVLTRDDLATLRTTVAETGRIWAVDFSERFEVPAMTRALELIAAGEIGEVIGTVGLGPHRLNAATRPDWFWDRTRNGGILADIGSHQIDQFLAVTGEDSAEVILAHAACHRQNGFQDFGEIVLQAGKARGFVRLDWYTPDALPNWGDGRLFVTGTKGTLELRKYVDPGGVPGTDHVILVNGEVCRMEQASEAGLPFFAALAHDIRHRTETAMPQERVFTVCDLALTAQELAEC